MNPWESVITRIRVNDGFYYGENRLQELRWEWPKGTWFQARLEHAREHEPVWRLKTGRNKNPPAATYQHDDSKWDDPGVALRRSCSANFKVADS